jgi:hypothetical protein
MRHARRAAFLTKIGGSRGLRLRERPGPGWLWLLAWHQRRAVGILNIPERLHGLAAALAADQPLAERDQRSPRFKPEIGKLLLGHRNAVAASQAVDRDAGHEKRSRLECQLQFLVAEVESRRGGADWSGMKANIGAGKIFGTSRNRPLSDSQYVKRQRKRLGRRGALPDFDDPENRALRKTEPIRRASQTGDDG